MGTLLTVNIIPGISLSRFDPPRCCCCCCCTCATYEHDTRNKRRQWSDYSSNHTSGYVQRKRVVKKQTQLPLIFFHHNFYHNIIFAPFFCPSLLLTSRNSDSGSRLIVAWTSLLSPIRTVRAVCLYREKTSAISSLAGSRRIVPTRARRLTA